MPFFVFGELIDAIRLTDFTFLYIWLMINTQYSDSIRQTVDKYLPGSRIVLFGSRARGEAKPLSDYDLLVITPQIFSEKEKISMLTLLDNALVKNVNLPFDLLIQSEDEIKLKKELPGNIIRSIIKEGVTL